MAESPEKRDYSKLVPAVDQANRILFALAAARGGIGSLTELCHEVDISKSKCLALLATLQGSGLVVRDEQSKLYRLGPGLLVLSRALLSNADMLAESGPYLLRLAEVTSSTAFFGTISERQLYVIGRRRPPGQPLAQISVDVGDRFPVYYGAHGIAILAALPSAERERVLGEEDLRFDGALKDMTTLRAEVDECCRLGYARDLGSINPGVNVVAAALLDHRSRPIGSMLVTGTFPAAKAAEFGGYVVEAARVMILRLPLQL